MTLRRYAIFLRGVMPSGRNHVPMAALREALSAGGLAEVRTYIQSGNAVARSALGPVALERHVRELIAQRIGADIQVVVRSPQALARVLSGNPFAQAPSERVYFTLLQKAPDAALVAALQAMDAAPDALRVHGSTIYTLVATQASDSRLTNSFYERRLKAVASSRNFNTLARMAALSALSGLRSSKTG